MATRKAPKHLIATYVRRRPEGDFTARVVDSRTKRENRCAKPTMPEAVACSRTKVMT